MADWNLSGTYLEFCSCEPGCGCNFVSVPNSKEGNCQALISHRVEGGSFDGVELAGAKVSWALWWPGAIHEGGGKGHVFVDAESDEQFDALASIWRGEAGYALFEIFNSTFDKTSDVERASIDMTVDGKSSKVSIDGVAEGVMKPLYGVSGSENDVRIVSDTGFIFKDGQVATNELMKVNADGINFELSGRHSIFAPFEYSNAA
jgi:hypothetical protein